MKSLRIFFSILALLSSLLLFSQNNNHVLTFSGNGHQGFVNGPIDSAQYDKPYGICADGHGNFFIPEGGKDCIRKINTATGQVTTYAGSGITGFRDGPADSAQFDTPNAVCVDDSGNVYVPDYWNQRIRKISAGGMVTTVAGSGMAGYLDGPALSARFNNPRSICRDATGNLYVADSWNHRVRKISPSGEVSTWAGGGTDTVFLVNGGYIDGPDTSARFNVPCSVSIDDLGNIYVADAYNHSIRKIDPDRIVSTLAGSGPTGSDSGGYANGYFHSSRFKIPLNVLVFDSNTILVSDNNRIRKLNLRDTLVNTFAGSCEIGFTTGVDTAVKLKSPGGLTKSGGLAYFIDGGNYAIRVVIPDSLSGIPPSICPAVINIYPNPASGKIRVNITAGSYPFRIRFTDIIGRVMLTQDVSSAGQDIDVTHLLPGLYIMQVWQGTPVSVVRFIKI